MGFSLEGNMPRSIETDEDIGRILELCRSQPKDMPVKDVIRKAFELYEAEPRLQPKSKQVSKEQGPKAA